MNSISSHELETHATFVRQLARSLVRGDLDPEDLAQETWLRALRRPRPAPPALRRWLSGIARNVSREWRRGRRRTGERERQSAAAATGIDAAASAERCEQVSQLIAALKALPEPYRSVLLQRYYEARTPAEIAATRGVPPATVRSQLHRGLQLLRARLDAGHGGDRTRWCRALAPLLTKADPGTVLAVGSSAMRVWALGKLLGAAALLVVMGLAWRVARGPHDAPPSPDTERSGRMPPAVAAAASVPAVSLHVTRTAQEGSDGLAPATIYSGAQLLVVEAAGDRPLPGADVKFVDVDYALELAPSWPRRWTDWPEPARAVLRTDEDGRVRLPPFAGRARIEARRAGLFGMRFVNAASSHVLKLGSPQRLLVRVTDSDNRPQPGVPLVLWEAVPEDDVLQYFEVALWRGRTGKDGTAVIETVDALLAHSALGGEPRSPWSPAVGVVGFDFPLREGPAEVVVPGHLPAEPIRLVLPPTGSLRANLVDGSGAPVHEAAQFALWHGARAPGEPQYAPRAVERLGPGGFRFSHVGLGLALELHASGNHAGGFDDVSCDFDGPVRAGQEIEVELEVEPHPVLEAHLLDPEGEPIRLQRILAGWVAGSPEHPASLDLGGGGPLATDASGRLRASRPPVAVRGRLRFRTFAAVDPGAEGRALAALVPVQLDENESLDLGQIRLLPASPMVAGRLLDADGTPIRGGKVAPVRWRSEWGPLTKRLQRLAPEGPPEATGPAVFTSVTGSFVIREAAPAAPLCLCVTVGDEICFAAMPRTQQDAELILPARAALRGRLLLDPHIPTRALEVDLHRGPWRGTHRGGPECSAPVGDDGSFVLRGGTPGRCRLSVRFATFEGNEVWTLEDLWLKKGTVTEAPDFDLRGRIGWARVTVRDAGGALVLHPAVSVLQSDANGTLWREASIRAAGSVPVLFPGSPLDLEIGAPGHRSVRLSGVSGEIEVELPPGIEVWVRPAGPGLDLLEPGDRLAIDLVPEDLTTAWAFGLRQEVPVHPRDGIRLSLSRPGRFGIHWTLGWQDRRGLVPMGAADVTIEVADQSGPQWFEAPLTAEHVQRGREARARRTPWPVPLPTADLEKMENHH